MPPKKEMSAGKIIGIVAIIVFVLVIIINLASGSSSNNTASTSGGTAQTTNSQQSPCAAYTDANALAQNASSVSYKELEKDPSSYMGIPVVFTGEVVQILEQNGQGVIRLAVTKDTFGNWDSNSIVYIQYGGHNDVVDNDVVTVYGLLAGPQTYTSQANFQITVPSMYACFVTKKIATDTTGGSAPTQQTQTTQTPEPQASTDTWHTVLTYTGPDTQDTAPFTMQGSQWKFVYSCSADSPTTSADAWAGRLTGIIDSVSTGEEVNLFVNGACPQSNTSYAYNQAPGQYALQVNSYNATYSITIEDYY